jgi:hypothetical protein
MLATLSLHCWYISTGRPAFLKNLRFCATRSANSSAIERIQCGGN